MTEGVPQGLEIGGPVTAAFVGYLLLVVGIGLWATRFSSAGIGEFFLGGRRMNRFVVALSAVVSGRSAWLLLGVTGMAYSRGASAVWAVAGYVVVELLLFLFYAPRLRRFSEAYDCLTVPDFFAARFGDRGGGLRLLLVAVILIFMVSYVAAQFVAGGKAFGASFGMDPDAGVALTAAIVLLYTVLGGFLAVSVTDLLQALFMIVALVALPVAAVTRAGGLPGVVAELTALDATLVDPWALSAGALLGFLGIGLGSPGNPHILVRYMSIGDPDQLRTSAVVGTVWNVLMGWGALFIGLAGRVYFPDPAALPGADTENLYPTLAALHLHPVLLGLVIASIFAAIMSTADSQLLVAASSVVRDLYEKVLRRGRELPQRRLVVLSRVVVVALVALALGLGLVASEIVFWLVLFAWAGLGAALGPASLLALFWRRTTRAGVAAGIVTGTAVTLLWQSTPALDAALYELIPAFLLATVATVGVSLLGQPPDDAAGMLRRMRPPTAGGSDAAG
ncbi:MAG: sodium/proline symporter [Thermoanaerobaculia bacterium]|nr:sodium/proline symporter [Thermoanaerobaculia bacterium]